MMRQETFAEDSRLPRRRRDGLVEDLILLAAQMPWQLGAALAGLSYLLLHFLLARLGPLKVLLEILICFPLLVGAGVSAWRHRQAGTLFQAARDGADGSIESMSWSDFERLVAEAFRRKGYSVDENLLSGPDGGVDLVLRKQGETHLVQCKHWRTWAVDVKIVRELKGVMATRCAAHGFVVASGKFTREAAEFALKAGIELVDAGELVRGADQPSQLWTADVAPIISAATAPSCPKCGSEMKMRTAKRGPQAGSQFWGCETYPRCRGTRAA